MSLLTRHADRNRRLAGDDGGVLLEFAFVVPILTGFLLGTFEIGMMVRNANTMRSAIRLGTRTIANLEGTTNRRLAEYAGLDVTRTILAGMKRTTITKVVVYAPANANGDLPAACLSTAPSNSGAGSSNVCNIYNQYQLTNMTTANFGGSATNTTCSGTDWDRFWCPTDNSTRSNDVPAGLDDVCMYIEYQYTFITKFLPFGTTRTMTDRACMQIEPKT